MTDTREATLVCPGCGAARDVVYSPYSPVKAVQCSSCGFSIPLPQRSAVAAASPRQQSATALPQPAPSPRPGLAGRLVAGIVGGFILGTLAANVCTLALGDFRQEQSSPLVTSLAVVLLLGLLAVAIVIAVRAERPAKAWRRILIPSGIISLAIPLAALIPTFRAAGEAEARGSSIEALAYGSAGTAFAIIVGFFGIVLGAILLVIGLLVGRDAGQSGRQAGPNPRASGT